MYKEEGNLVTLRPLLCNTYNPVCMFSIITLGGKIMLVVVVYVACLI